MANATKVITLPAPYVPIAGVTRWIPGPIVLDHLGERATVQLVAGNADGSRVEGANAYSVSFGVTGAAYRELFNTPNGQAVAAGLLQMIVAGGQAAQRPELPQGTTIDAVV